jgi:hypothetical protein
VNGNESDGKIPEQTAVTITPFHDDQMFQRWLLDRIHQRHEMEFERGALPAVIGFLTGMDDQFYSVSTTGEFPPRSRILPRHSVTMISETDRSLHDLDQRTEVLIKRYTARIHRACADQLIPTQRMRPSSLDRVSQQSV